MTGAALVALDAAALQQRRAGSRFGAAIHYFERLDSTSTTAFDLARSGAADGTVVIAEAQTRGRGRLGRSWVSPPFCNLYLSVVLRPPIAATAAPQLTLVAGVALAEVVGLWTPGATIKWPNDVLVDGRKLAGVLTEMEADGDLVRFVILGIGVNLNSVMDDFPAELHDKATSLRLATGAAVDRVAFADALLARLEERYQLFLHSGFGAIRPLWEARSGLTGHVVAVDEGGRQQTGTVIGIDEDGVLLLHTASGERRIVAGEVTVIDGYGPRRQTSAHGARQTKDTGTTDS